MTATDSISMQLAMLWASVSNTMPALFWSLFYILDDPKWYRLAREEAQTLKSLCTKPDNPIIDTEILQSDAMNGYVVCVSW